MNSPFPGMDPYLESKWPIPLRPGERDVVLQLQPLIDDCYRDGRYHRIDYQIDPKPKFDEADALWIDSRLREQSRRAQTSSPPG